MEQYFTVTYRWWGPLNRATQKLAGEQGRQDLAQAILQGRKLARFQQRRNHDGREVPRAQRDEALADRRKREHLQIEGSLCVRKEAEEDQTMDGWA